MKRLNLQMFASDDYWRKREEQNLRDNLLKEKEYDKEIERIYEEMLDATQKEIDAFYGKYAKEEGISLAEAKKRVSELDIEEYERKAKRYVNDPTSDKFSKRANEEMRLYNLTMKVNRLEMLKANIGLELIKGHSKLEKFMNKILKCRTEAELERQAGILGKTIRNNAKMAHSIVNASFKNATFSDRIWMYHNQMKADMSKLLQSGLIQGKSSRQLAKDLRKYYYGPEYLKNGRNGAIYATERLMRTELARVQTEAQRQSFERNGFEEYTFLALGDACDICTAINGKHFKVKDMMPGENAPPIHPHCRCSISAYEDSDEYEAWLDFLDKGGTTSQWRKIKEIEGTPFKTGRSVGAMARRFYVKDKKNLKGSDNLYIKENTYVEGVKVIAYGDKIREVNRLIDDYPISETKKTKAKDWYKVRGRAIIVDENGNEQAREVHWYQADNVGKVEFKFPTNKKQR